MDLAVRFQPVCSFLIWQLVHCKYELHCISKYDKYGAWHGEGFSVFNSFNGEKMLTGFFLHTFVSRFKWRCLWIEWGLLDVLGDDAVHTSWELMEYLQFSVSPFDISMHHPKCYKRLSFFRSCRPVLLFSSRLLWGRSLVLVTGSHNLHNRRHQEGAWQAVCRQGTQPPKVKNSWWKKSGFDRGSVVWDEFFPNQFASLPAEEDVLEFTV